MTNNTKFNLQIISAVILMIVGCALLIAGFIVNPLGVIHGSVLTAFGETCTFGGALFGIDCSYRYKLKKYLFEKDHKKNE